MEKKLLLLVVVLMVLCSSAALALSPMGPPTAGLKKGQWSTGVDYSYSKMDLKFNEGKWSGSMYDAAGNLLGSDAGTLDSFTIKNAKFNKVYANLGYGISDNWEAFLRLGAGNADLEDFDGDYGFAFGFGTKVTFWEQTADLKWGGLFQMGWVNSDADFTYSQDFEYEGEEYEVDLSASGEADLYEIQIAVGPTYKLRENVSIYGGPFFHFIDGDLDGKGTATVAGIGSMSGNISYDIDERSIFGGYIGAQVDVTENLPFYIEWQHTEHADAFVMGLVYRF